MAGPWEKYQNAAPVEEGPWTKYAAAPSVSAPQPAPEKSAASIVDMVRQASGMDLSPVGMLEKANDLITKGANKTGEFIANESARQGLDPRIAAAVGTAVQMGPDVATLAGPEEAANLANSGFKDSATMFARRALGLSKRQLNTPFARGQAAKAAETALQEGVIPALGSRAVMRDRATELANRAGDELGKIRESVGPAKIDDIFGSLENLREKLTKGRKGGAWDAIHSKIDNAQETLLGLLDNSGTATLNDVTEAKKVLKGSTSYLSDLSSQKTTKEIVKSVENGIEDVIKKSGKDVNQYRKAKDTYGSAKKMLEGLDNALSGEEGNNLFGLVSSMGGAAKAASGSLPGAASALGGIELVKRRGSGALAHILDAIDSRMTEPNWRNQGVSLFGQGTPFRNLVARVLSSRVGGQERR